ncbi:MAG: PLP-dependent aminotransferase family protein [Conexibacter sp.]
MAVRAVGSAVATLTLDSASPVPLHQQLADGVRSLILTRQLGPATKLPSTRSLAETLDVSRNTVLTAFEELLAEGYLESRVGAGTFVASSLPDELLKAHAVSVASQGAGPSTPGLSRRGALLAATPVTHASTGPRPFRPAVPALDVFPLQEWSRVVARCWRSAQHLDMLGYGDPAGYPPLRQAIADYVATTRAVRCEAENVIVVNGSQQALDLAARILLDPGDAVWMEDPGRRGARGALLAASAQLVPVPIDREGLDIAHGLANAPSARLAYVSTSHQFPLGVTMSLSRRLALLDWARRSSAWIIEDDSDGEYRYAGRPLPALQGLDNADRAIYIGTFSRMMFPALRLGYLVVPRSLVPAFAAAKSVLDRQSSVVDQAALGEFIADGSFVRHVRRMRKLYAARQAKLIELAREHLDGLVDVRPAEAGMHVIGWLARGLDDTVVEQAARSAGVEVIALSRYALRPLDRFGILLGYAVADEAQTQAAVRKLAAAIRSTGS